MGYGRSSGGIALPLTLQCGECGLSVTLHQTIGKDYIFEETVREAERQLEAIGWRIDGHSAWCKECAPRWEVAHFPVNNDGPYTPSSGGRRTIGVRCKHCGRAIVNCGRYSALEACPGCNSL